MAEKSVVSDVVHPNCKCTTIPAEEYIDVCGVRFLYKEIESNGRGDVSMGRSDSKMAVITINEDMPKEMKESTLIHEWIHAVLDCAGMGEYSGDEKLVCALQNELYRAGFRVKKLPM